MVSRWFQRGNRLEHADAAIRRQALEALTPEQTAAEQQRLAELVQRDPDPAVRQCAAGLLSDDQLLTGLLENTDTCELAAAQVVALMAHRQLSCTTHPAVLNARINLAGPQDIERLLADIDDPAAAAALALRMRGEAREQVLHARQLNDEAGLHALIKAAKGHDKSLHRYARERVDTIKQARKACEAALARLADIDDSAARQLAQEAGAALSIPARQKLERLAAMRSEACATLQQHRNALAQAGANPEPFTAPADPLDGVDLSIAAPQHDPFAELIDTMQTLAQQMRAGTSLSELVDQRNSLADAWLQHADQQPPSAQQHDAFAKFSGQFQEYRGAWERASACSPSCSQAPEPLPAEVELAHAHQLAGKRNAWLKRWSKAIEAIHWPTGHTMPEDLSQPLATLARVSGELADLAGRQAEARARLAELLEQAQQAVDGGNVKQATAVLRNARPLQQAGIHDFDAELGVLSARLDQLRDWQSFVTHPKRQELLDALAVLADTPLEAPAQAERLRDLRDQWRQLGGANNAEEAQMLKDFDTLAERAFEPCKQFYAEQAARRAENLQQRILICEQLEDYLGATDWANVDLQAADQIMRTARQAWRQYHPCDHKALKPVQQRFETLQSQLHGHLKAAWDANADQRRKLIEQARALLDGPLEEQINGAKALQHQWRDVGPVPRKLDQRLWAEFRKICDQIFAGRDAAKQADQAAEQARLQAVEAAISDLELAVRTTAEPVSRGALRALQQNIDDARAGQRVPPVLHRRTQTAIDAYQARLADQAAAEAAAELDRWEAWDAAVSSAEQSGSDIEPPHAAFVDRIKGSAVPLDWQRQVIEAEIAAEISGPADEQGRRMEIQVELMNSGSRPQDRTVTDFCRSWCGAGPKEPSVDVFRARFFAALRHRLASQ